MYLDSATEGLALDVDRLLIKKQTVFKTLILFTSIGDTTFKLDALN